MGRIRQGPGLWVIALCCVALMMLTGPTAARAQVPAHGPVYPTAHDDEQPLRMRAGPGLGYAIVGYVPAGASVEVLCQARGDYVSDPRYGNTPWWDWVRYGGTEAYVTDLYVLSGTDRVAPDCPPGLRVGTTPPPPGPPGTPPPPPPDPQPPPGAPADGPPAPLNAPGCTAEVRVGAAVALASCFTRDGNRQVSRGRTRVNGLDVSPGESAAVVADPGGRRIYSEGTVDVRLGPVLLYRGRIDWRTTGPLAFSVVSAGDDADPRDNTLAGLPVKGSIGITFADGATTGELGVGLPGPFGGLTTSVRVRADNQRGLMLDEATLNLDAVTLGPAELRDAQIGYSSEGGGRWQGGVTFYPSKVQAFSIGGSIGFGLDGYFALAGQVDGLNKPLVGGVFWQRARAALSINPFSLGGGLGVTYGPQFKLIGEAPISAASLDGDFLYTDGDPATFRLSGNGRVVNANFNGAVQVTTHGAVDANGNLEWKFGDYGLDANIVGWYESSAFELIGSATLVLPGPDLGADAIASSEGLAGCTRGWFRWGVGYRWRTRQLQVMAGTCGLDSWRVARPSGIAAAAARAAGVRGLAANAGGARFRVSRHTRTAAFSAVGRTAAPKLVLTGPRGLRVETPSGPTDVVNTRKAYLFQDQGNRTTYLAINRPARGLYRLGVAPGSSAVTRFRSSESRPRPRVRARVRRAGRGRRALRWSIRGLAGGRVTFIEEGRGLRRVVRRTRRARGAVRFRPALGPGGRRRVRALVEQHGLPQVSRTVARYRTRRVRPSPPRRVRIRRDRVSALVSWRGPPRSAYRVLARTTDGRRIRLAVDPAPRKRRAVRITALPRRTGLRVAVRRLVPEGGLSAAARARSR
jgi:uncharacterized protein YraI